MFGFSINPKMCINSMHFGKKFGTGKRASYKRDIFLFEAKDV